MFRIREWSGCLSYEGLTPVRRLFLSLYRGGEGGEGYVDD